MRTILATSLIAAGAIFCQTPALADTIVSDTVGLRTNTHAPAQSLTTPGGGPWNNIEFNWYDANFNPLAGGDLFILTSAYAGTPGGLNSATPGFVAESQSISSNEYVFNPSLVLQPNTTYYFYTDTFLDVSGGDDTYAGGMAFGAFSTSPNTFFPDPGEDSNFRLLGTATAAPVPEPSSILLLGGVMLSVGLAGRKRLRA